MLFEELSAYFEQLESASKRLDKFVILAEMFAQLEGGELSNAAFLVQGVLAAPFRGVELNISSKLLLRAMALHMSNSRLKGEPENKVAGNSLECSRQKLLAELTNRFNLCGDLGIVAQEISGKEHGKLTVSMVFERLKKISGVTGSGSVDIKLAGLAALFDESSPLGARYIARFVMGRLRLGAGIATILEALCKAVGDGKEIAVQINNTENRIAELRAGPAKNDSLDNSLDNSLDDAELKTRTKAAKEQIKQAKAKLAGLKLKMKRYKQELEAAYNNCPDIGIIAEKLESGGYDEIRAVRPTIGYPVKVALCERLAKPEDIIAKLGHCAVEIKYDGLRLQVHKDGDRVEMFSRNLERITDMFPEITMLVRQKLALNRAIIEGEVISYNSQTGRLMPFQTTMQRKRKHNIAEKAKDVPLRLFVFDLLLAEEVDYTKLSYKERRTRLKSVIKDDRNILLSEAKEIGDPEEIADYFDYAIAESYEGIIAKRLDAPYVAGARNFNWIKFKKSYSSTLNDTLDICIIGYYHGRGSRARFGIGAILGAVYDDVNDRFVTIAKVGTGFTENDLKCLKKNLDDIKLDERPVNCYSKMKADVWVEPKFIVTVTADEVSRSAIHTCGLNIDLNIDINELNNTGYALRFPRADSILRPDKSATDATTVSEVIELFNMQTNINKGDI